MKLTTYQLDVAPFFPVFEMPVTTTSPRAQKVTPLIPDTQGVSPLAAR